MINGEFVNNLTSLLNDVTTSGKNQTRYDVDTKITTMGLTVCKNFKEVPVFESGTSFRTVFDRLRSKLEVFRAC